MKILLDTQAFIWAGLDAPELSHRARDSINDPGNELVLSIVSAWEMAIKSSLGRLRLETSLREFILTGLRRPGLSLQGLKLAHALTVEDLPFHHRDPFDRLLIAQALVEDWPVVSIDGAFDPYGVERIW